MRVFSPLIAATATFALNAGLWFRRGRLAMVFSSLAASCRRCAENPLIPAVQISGTTSNFNSDQGSQFTGIDFITVLKDAKIAISMDGKGAWRDNVFVERLWRTVKYEEIYLRAYCSVSEARASIGRYLCFYNGT